MAEHTNPESTVWGFDCHEECIKANHPYDTYSKLYKRQFKRSTKRNKQTNRRKHNNLCPTIRVILFDETKWCQLFQYKHKNTHYLKRQTTQTFYEWHCETSTDQTPNTNSRNQTGIVSIVDEMHALY
eukprot:7142_1